VAERSDSHRCSQLHKNRLKFTKELPHFSWFDGRFATAVPWKADPSLKLWELSFRAYRENWLTSRVKTNLCYLFDNSTDISVTNRRFQCPVECRWSTVGEKSRPVTGALHPVSNVQSL